ncbi:MAG: response regulator [Gilvibacter sp.]
MRKVLLVEDDALLRENTAELLELAGYNMVTAPNGNVGIQKAKSELPDVIVCDIMMPEVDGYGVLEAISNDPKTQAIPFIFLSAKTERQEVRKGMDLGADDYLTKPFLEDELISAIESRIAKATILADKNKSEDNAGGISLNGIERLMGLFEAKGELEECKSGDTIYSHGDHAHYVHLIKSGVVKCTTMDQNGKELTTGLYHADQFIGLTSFTAAVSHTETATCIEACEILKLSKSQVKEVLLKDRGVTLQLVDVMADHLIEIKEQLLQMAYGSVRKKTAQTILQFSEIMQTKHSGVLKISRNDLATVAGIATESLIRTLSQFKKEGWIKIEGRNISILNLAALENVE